MEEYASSTWRPRPTDEFIRTVFSWSLEDIFDENLYRNQVERIPLSFQSVDQYLGSYVYPLMEETRAELAAAMESIYNAPFAELIGLHEAKPYDINTLRYDVQVDSWKNRKGDGGRESYRTLPGDVVLISQGKPESVDDLLRTGWRWTFALVYMIPEVENDDSYTSTSFKVKAGSPIEVEDEQHKSMYVIFLTNVTTNQRIWNALCMRPNIGIIGTVLCKNDLAEEACEFCSVQGDTELSVQLEPTVLSKLNESQQEAILSSIQEMRCDHKSSIKLIWGPPGTGKTRTLSAMIFFLFKMNVRTLVCAPTNVAITDLASRVIKLIRECFEVGCENFVTCPLGDILIFGNKERLKFGSEIEEIFLDYRVDRLVDCFAPTTGLKRCISSVICFLEDCVSEHCIYVESELIKAKESNEDEVQKAEPKSLREFVRDRFSHTVLPLKRSLLTFVTHLPRSFTDDQIVQYTVQLVSLFDRLETLFFQDKLTSEELETMFSHKEIVHSSSFSPDLSSLLNMKAQCLSVLKSLQCSVAKLELPSAMNKYSIMKFCFKNSSLIFCTASSSFKLHTVDIEPIKLLVIDEAAQLKECGSTIPLQLPGLMHTILGGDECQLPAIVISKLSEEAGFGRSLFSRLSSLGHSKHLLDMQYRMHPSISSFPNAKFYLKKIIDAPNVKDKSYERSYLPGRIFGPYSFINVSEGKEELDDYSHSLMNMVEVAITVKIVQKLYKAWNGSHEKLSVGVISPYAAQVMAIQNKLRVENNESFTVAVKSVDGFQGGEKDVIIISTVRSNNGGSIGFLASPQRTNVALTRARHCLWILGNERTLTNSNSIWQALICNAKNRRCFFYADEDSDIAKTIVDVKKDLDQLDDLLSGESILFKSSRWKVLFSDNFKSSFGKLISSRVKKSVINILLKVASGWRPKRRSVDLKCEFSLQNVKQFKVEGYYVVCTIDIMKESNYIQVLKVWDILPSEAVPMLLRRLDNISALCTDDFISRCKEKFIEGNLEVPKIWPRSHDIVRYKNTNSRLVDNSGDSAVDCRSYVENSKVSESLLLMKFYSLSTGTVNHLLSDQDGGELDLPFEVTDEEREIILFPESSFILGRSGTGKTTILTMKLYRNIEQHRFATEGLSSAESCMSVIRSADTSPGVGECRGNVLRQLFVTVSPKLCYAVKQHVSRLKSFASGRHFHTHSSSNDMDDIEEMEQFRDIPDSFVGIPADKYPLVITFHKFLLILDGTLGNSYFERFLDGKSISQGKGSLRSVAVQSFIRTKEVTFDRFRFVYWPHFNEKITKNLDPSRVFTEILSHIKGGSQEELEIKLNRDDYVSLSDKRVSTLCANDRNAVYDIFLDYEKRKTELGEFDLADFVINLHQRLYNVHLPGDKMDFVYIDEVQDLTMRQIALFNYICKNVDEGFVFSGDTAQTIARGVDFRFEDIRSLFYTDFVMKTKKIEFAGRTEKGHISDMFYLCQNFRTHSGVLRLAQSVIDLLCHFFPQSIDVMPPETSFVYGEPPVVLEPGSDENAIITIFGCSGNVGKMVGFGAEQVILVRDDSARKEIMNYIGHQALILTIVECKGLEFQDVLLFNFFGSSPLRSQWRIIYEFLKEKDMFDSGFPKSFPSFNQLKHNIMCSELKQLYVAITRTRQRLWICENIEELSRPMLDYWKKMGLVSVRKVDDSLAQAMQRASSPEEWKSQGIKLFCEKNYEMAIMCFERANEPIWEKRAKAASLRASADHICGSNPKEARIMLREAAELFYSVGKKNSAAECFYDLEEFERAGRIYLENGDESELKKAGECFTLAGRYELAAEVYAKGSFFEECLSACNNGNCFEIGLQYIDYWKQQASLGGDMTKRFKDLDIIVQEFLESCAMNSYKLNDKPSLMKFVRAFHSVESKRNFLRSLDCLEELLLLEEELSNFMEAAEIAKLIGNLPLEVDLLGKAGHFRDATLLALAYMLSCSLWGSGSKGWPLKSFPQKEELKHKALRFAEMESRNFHEIVCAQLKVLSHEQCNMSELLQCLNASQKHESFVAKILSVRKLLDAHLEIHPAKYDWEQELPFHLKRYSEERILRNQVSARTLFYIWNLFKDSILDLLESLDCLDKEEFSQCKSSIEFSLDYFGVRRMLNNLNVAYLLLKPGAEWVKNIDERFLRRQRKMAILDACHLVSACRTYWLREFQAIGLKVLETLADLYRFSLAKSFSLYCQSTCLNCIFDITNFFTEPNSVVCKNAPTRKFQNFLELSLKYFDIVFPLDSRMSLSENMISLRRTEVSRRLLEELILRNINTKKELTSGQIGRVMMIWLGSGRLKCELYEMIAARCPDSWKAFIEILSTTVDSDSSKSPAKDLVIGSANALITKFHETLADTYAANWMAEDYISPNCFLYLMERLVLLASQYRPFFFTTKSMFMEWLIYQQSDASQSSILVADKLPCPRGVFDFVVNVIRQFLCDANATKLWIKKSNIEFKYHRLLVLRLLTILCLVCLNSRLYSNVLFELLYYIRSQLPREFFEALRCRRRNEDVSINAVARAFKSIGDPLIIVMTGENNLKFTCSDAIFLDMRAPWCEKDIIEVLFPGSNITWHEQVTCAEANLNIPSSELPASTDNQRETSVVPISNMETRPDLNFTTVDFNDALQMNWVVLEELSDKLKSQENGKDRNLTILSWHKKADVIESVNISYTVLSNFCKKPRPPEAENLLDEATNAVEELKQLISLMNISGLEMKDVLKIGELVKSLLSRRPKLDVFLRQFDMQSAADERDESIVSTEEEISQSKVTEGGKKDFSVASAPGPQTKSQPNQPSESGHGKGKAKKKKSARGKGGRKK